MRVLVLCKKVPYPSTDGESIVIMNDIQTFRDLGHEVFVLCLNTKKHHVLTDDYAQLPFWTDFRDFTIDTNSIFTGIKALWSSNPFQIARFYDSKIDRSIEDYIALHAIDVLIYHGLAMTLYHKKNSNVSKIYRVHNVENRIWRAMVAHTMSVIKKMLYSKISSSLKEYEESELENIQHLVSLSQDENDFFQHHYPYKSSAIGIHIDTKFQTSYDSKKEGILFVGSLDWKPNVEGLEWFLEHIYPFVSDISLTIAGKGNYTLSSHPNIRIIRNFKNMEDLLSSHRMMIVPLLSGAGIRIKILEGMNFGIPIISTAIGVEGIAYLADSIIVADDSEDWIARVKDIYANEDKRVEMSHLSKESFQTYFSKNEIVKQWQVVFDEM